MAIRQSRKSSSFRNLSQLLKRRKQHDQQQKRQLLLESLEKRCLMAVGPTLISVQPNTGSLLSEGDVLRVAPNEILFNFVNDSGSLLNGSTINLNTFKVTRSGNDGTFGNGNDIPVTLGYLNTDETGLGVQMRFTDPLPDDTYRITIVGAGPSLSSKLDEVRDALGNPFNGGVNLNRTFRLNLGAQVLTVVPQPVSRTAAGALTQARDKIDVYFNKDDLNLTAAQNPAFYQLILTNNTVTPLDDVASGVINPTSVVYDAATDKATLTFSKPLDQLNPKNFALRLRIGTNEALDSTSYGLVNANDPNSTFNAALNVGTLNGIKNYSDSISTKTYNIQWPGGNDDPGHRDNPVETHIPDDATDTSGITVQPYNFKYLIGSISNGSGGTQPAFNVITESQKQRAREIFDLYGRYAGINFVETQDQGITVATGDLRVLDPTIVTGPGGVAGLGGPGMALMDSAENWSDQYGENWFQVAMHEIGHALGLGHSYDLPPLTIQGEDGTLVGTSPGGEPVFPGDGDIDHIRRLYRPEGQDIDMYKFTIAAGQTGVFSAEVMAERLGQASTLDSNLHLYREGTSGRELIASNDDYFSKDSFIQVQLSAGTYYVGVTAHGNDQYDPSIPDTGMNGTSEGAYRLQLNFRPNVSASRSIVDTTGVAFDGDADGVAGGVDNFWFKTAPLTRANAQAPRTIFVDRVAANGGDGTLAAPFNNISTALAAANPGDIVRIEGNAGADGKMDTLGDNFAYQIGFDQINAQPLRDGSSLVVPKNVTVMVDAGAIFQMRRSRIQVGSTETTTGTDRSGGALQVLGTPTQSVYFTSFNDTAIGLDMNPLNTTPAAGDWGGILFRNDQDRADGRFDWERQGIFLNHVAFADFRYGGGQVNLDGGTQAVITPIYMIDARPTVVNNVITRSADAAMSASPNSFEETTFHEPQYQPDSMYSRSFNVDYTRVGPEIHGNILKSVEVVNGTPITYTNSINGLFVRAKTPAGGSLQELTVTGRFNDTDIVHVVAENLVLHGSPSGAVLEGATANPADPTISDGKPPVNLIIMSQKTGGSLPANTYYYRIVYVDQFGNEGRVSDERSITVTSNNSSVQLAQLPKVPPRNILQTDYNERFISRRIYRLNNAGEWAYVAQVPDTVTTFVDTGATPDMVRRLNPAVLTTTHGPSAFVTRPRTDASLKIDPSIIVKFDSSRIELGMGSSMIAEGLDGQEVIFTSLADDRYGAGGTYDTRNDQNSNKPNPGDWGGIFAGPNSRLSLDEAAVFYAGGTNRVEGDFVGFNPVEIHQADARVANTLFQFNADGQGGSVSTRVGRGTNAEGTIFVRGAQPIIVNNVVRGNEGSVININVNALNSDLVVDYGRQSGLINPNPSRPDKVAGHYDNNGPLILGNRLVNNGLNGMTVRGGVLTTESVWDDTDMVHILLDTVSVTDFHTFGGLRLESNPRESLVVKSKTRNPSSPAGFYVNGKPNDNEDRIGGIIQVLGQPGYPVVLTSLGDDTVGAGFQPDGTPSTDTDGNGLGSGSLPTGPEVDRGTLIDNDVIDTVPGYFSFQADNGGSASSASVTAQGKTQLFQNTNFLFDFTNYVDVGSDGNAVSLANSTITQPATLVSPDTVVSTGTLQGANGVINWRAESKLNNGESRVYNTITFTSATPLGNMRFINYMDEDVGGISDDFLYTTGTPGQNDFRVYTLDNTERVGFAQGGFLTSGTQLVNAKYTGFAADSFPNLDFAITGKGTAYTTTGNINTTNLPVINDPFLGKIYGLNDITSAFAWDVDATATSATITSFLELVATPPATSAGDWQGIIIDKYAHDRNVDTVLEKEDPTLAGAGSNGTAITSQALGALAPFEKGGDENRRLGYTVHGVLSTPKDVDVYSFTAQAGTEVWIDIDRTQQPLDTVVELIDSDGVVLARSMDSYLEDLGTQGLKGLGLPLRRTPPNGGRDFYTTNPKDAGMRVVLPGPNGSSSGYFVRVRSAGTNMNLTTTGQTAGAYQMQIRLQEKDEIGGTVIRYSDIRYAVNGIDIRGQVIHSPLTGEHADIDNAGGSNDTQATAQNVGNAAAVDRGAVSIAGSINNLTDVDWYQFNVDIQQLQGLESPATAALYHMMFDIDYADGFARPNTVMNVYDAAGHLILSSRDSSIADDQPAPLVAANIEDLLRGSAGAADPFIGPVAIPAGFNNAVTTYYVAVSNDTRLPADYEQFFQKVPTDQRSRFARFEPVNSIKRIVEDHINDPAGNPAGTAAQRGTGALADVQILFDSSSAVPFSFSDVNVVVQRESVRTDFPGDLPHIATDTILVNPYTGGEKAFVGHNDYELGDFAFRADKQMFGYSMDVRGPGRPKTNNYIDDAETGHYLQINPDDGSAADLGDDGIETNEFDPQGQREKIAIAHLLGNARVGYGVQVEALAFGKLRDANGLTNGVGQNLIVVGNRGDSGKYGFNANDDISPKRNLVYQMDPNTGAPLVTGGPLKLPGDPSIYVGALTSAFEIGEILTAPQLITVDATRLDTAVNPNVTRFDIQDGTTFVINHPTGQQGFEFDAGPEVLQSIDVLSGRTVKDGFFFTLDPDTDPNNNNETFYQFDTGDVIAVNAPTNAMRDGGTIAINDTVGRTVTFELDRDGAVNNAANVAVDISGNNPSFAGAQYIAAEINKQFAANKFGVQAFLAGDRISLIGDSATQLQNVTLTGSNAITVTGSSGAAPILQAVPGNQLADGQTFTIQRSQQAPVTFEFDNNGNSGVNTAITFNAGMTSTQVADAIRAAIQSAFQNSVSVYKAGDRVIISADGIGTDPTNGRDLFRAGTAPIVNLLTTKRVTQIPVEEFHTADQIGSGITPPPGQPVVYPGVRNAVNADTLGGFRAGAAFDRINFPPDVTATPTSRAVQRLDVSGMGEGKFNIWQTVPGSNTGVANFNYAIPFYAEDTAIQIASRAETAIDTAFNDPFFSQAQGDRIYLDGDSAFASADPPLTAAGLGPGGYITGTTIVDPDHNPNNRDDTMYAVSNAGGLYIVDLGTIQNANYPVDDPQKIRQVTTTYVTTSTDLIGINFQGLTQGPQTVEGGKYRDLLFGVDDQGRMYAFDHQGKLQPVFDRGATSVQLTYRDPADGALKPVTNARGISFSQLDSNLWHITPPSAGSGPYQRQNDPGHGINETYDGTRATITPDQGGYPKTGNSSYYFGDPTGAQTRGGLTYNAVGGAHGTLISNEFSLVGYSPSDQPNLYFNYYLNSEEAYANPNIDGLQIRDGVKVYISGTTPGNDVNSGEWHLISGDQMYNVPAPAVPNPSSEMWDFNNGDPNASWRQVRVPLGAFAGQEHLRLRFDFATSADMNVGDIDTVGSELRALPGRQLADGDTFQIDTQTYEFDMGFSLKLPVGADIRDGDSFTLRKNYTVAGVANSKQVRFEFDRGGGVTAGSVAIPVSSRDSASDVARRIVDAVRTRFGQIDTQAGRLNSDSIIPRYMNDDEINFDFASVLTVNTGATAGPRVQRIGGIGVAAGNVLVPIHRQMTSVEVANSIDSTLEAYYYDQTLSVRGTGAQYADGDSFTLTVGANNYDFEFETGYVLNVPNGAGVTDGDTLTFQLNGTTVVKFELDSNNSNPPNRIAFTPADSSIEIATKIANAINLLPAAQRANLGITPQVISGSRIYLGGAKTLTLNVTGNFSTTGTPGVTAGRTPVIHNPSDFTKPSDIAQAIRTALNIGFAGSNPALGATWSANDPARVTLLGVTGDDFQLAKNPPGMSLFLDTGSGDSVKTFKDILKIVNATVTDRGKLGLADVLEGDIDGGYESAGQGQNNNFEGLYIDDFVIGFAERGEMVTHASTSNAFTANPLLQKFQINLGDYQLEMRRAPAYTPEIAYKLDDPTAEGVSYDTNDRINESSVIIAPAGADIADGQTFTLGDGLNRLTFEFNRNGDPTVSPGNVAINFTPTNTDYEIAQLIRDAINSSDVQLVLKVSAQMSDGSLFGQVSTTNRVNLLGNVTLQPLGTAVPEVNDTLTKAIPIDFSLKPTFIANGFVGDNAFLGNVARDVDLFKITLAKGQTINIDIDAQQFGSSLDSLLRVFNSAGAQLAINNNAAARGEMSNTIDSYLTFTAPAAGTYYIGVSGSGNGTYNPSTGANTALGSTGGYQLEVSVATSSSSQIGEGVLIDNNAFFQDPLTLLPVLAVSTPLNMVAGVTYYIDVDSASVGSANDASVDVLGPAGTLQATNDTAAAPDEVATSDPYLVYTAKTTGLHQIVVRRKAFTTDDAYRLIVSTTPPSAVQVKINQERYGDDNLFRDQGQLIIDGNTISRSSKWGIVVDEGTRDNGTGAHQSPPRNLSKVNTARIVPGVVISNNVIYTNGSGGIRFAGVDNVAGQELGSIAYGRIINNTLYGRGSSAAPDVGILVEQNSAPTLLNNIVANFITGIQVAADSIGTTPPLTVIGGSLFQNNTTNVSAPGLVLDGTIILGSTEPLFVDPARENFYLKAFSKAIDSSIDSLVDRTYLTDIKNPLGISSSPILAPDRDVTGQLRIDDPAVDSPGGSGDNVFKDRGAIDRVDFFGPRSVITNPRDNDTEGKDADTTPTVVSLGNVALSDFRITLLDDGIGIDDFSVTANAVLLQDITSGTPKTLVRGTDYKFFYDATNNVIILKPTAGIWPLGKTYRITIDNSVTDGSPLVAIRDKAQNLLQPNRTNGKVIYEIYLGSAIDYGDAPSTFPVLKANNGASHVIVSGMRLGATISPETNGQPSTAANLDTSDDGLNTATYLFQPGLTSSFTLTATGTGVIDAWLDTNFNGVWEGTEKLVFINGAGISNQTKTFNFLFGAKGDPKGTTYLRVRFSRDGIATPGGQAPNGEVEDYQVTIVGSPYQNPAPGMRWDVDYNGVIDNRDALLISNVLQNYDTDNDGKVNPVALGLPRPPAANGYYWDVNGDGLVTQADANDVIAYLQAHPAPPPAMAMAAPPSGTTSTNYASSSVTYTSTASTSSTPVTTTTVAAAAPPPTTATDDAVNAAAQAWVSGTSTSSTSTTTKKTMSPTSSTSSTDLVDDFFAQF